MINDTIFTALNHIIPCGGLNPQGKEQDVAQSQHGEGQMCKNCLPQYRFLEKKPNGQSKTEFSRRLWLRHFAYPWAKRNK